MWYFLLFMISQRFFTVGLRSANSFSCLGDFPPKSRDLDKLHAQRTYIQHTSYILKSALKAKSDMSPKLPLNIFSMAANHRFLVVHPRNWFVCIRSPAVWKIRISEHPTHSYLPSCSSYRGHLGARLILNPSSTTYLLITGSYSVSLCTSFFICKVGS